jgi:hypothetical protein
LQENQVVPHMAEHSLPLFATDSACWGLWFSVLPTIPPDFSVIDVCPMQRSFIIPPDFSAIDVCPMQRSFIIPPDFNAIDVCPNAT